jgi:hypothetical protein
MLTWRAWRVAPARADVIASLPSPHPICGAGALTTTRATRCKARSSACLVLTRAHALLLAVAQGCCVAWKRRLCLRRSLGG